MAAGLIYKRVTQPAVFKATWGSPGDWFTLFDKFKSKLYGWQLARAEVEVDRLKSKWAPACCKIAMLENLLLHDISSQSEILKRLDVQVAESADATKQAIQDRIAVLRESIPKKDAKRFVTLKKRITSLNEKATKLKARFDAIEAKMKRAYEQDNLALMQKSKNWSGLETLLTTFKEGIAERMMKGDEMSVSILQELHHSTGIRFNEAKIRKALAKAKEAIEKDKAPQERASTFKALVESIGEPISVFLARTEENVTSIPAFDKRKKRK